MTNLNWTQIKSKKNKRWSGLLLLGGAPRVLRSNPSLERCFSSSVVLLSRPSFLLVLLAPPPPLGCCCFPHPVLLAVSLSSFCCAVFSSSSLGRCCRLLFFWFEFKLNNVIKLNWLKITPHQHQVRNVEVTWWWPLPSFFGVGAAFPLLCPSFWVASSSFGWLLLLLRGGYSGGGGCVQNQKRRQDARLKTEFTSKGKFIIEREMNKTKNIQKEKRKRNMWKSNEKQ